MIKCQSTIINTSISYVQNAKAVKYWLMISTRKPIAQNVALYSKTIPYSNYQMSYKPKKTKTKTYTGSGEKPTGKSN